MRKDFLVGYTGFVGSNLAAKHEFSECFNSKNIELAFGASPDLLVYAGVPAEMFLAAHDPEADMRIIRQSEENIRRIAPKNIVLISTIAVYPETHGADEDTPIEVNRLSAYGANRYALEQWVEDNFSNRLVIRLPALYGANLKKNFLYDYLKVIPKRLSKSKLLELLKREPCLCSYYEDEENGFFRCRKLSENEERFLKKKFESIGFSALNFTDSRARYQFFDLSQLWNVIEIALKNKIDRLNVTVPPIEIGELYQELSGESFSNELDKIPFDYDLRSKYASLFDGHDGYFCSKEDVLNSIRNFIDAESRAGL